MYFHHAFLKKCFVVPYIMIHFKIPFPPLPSSCHFIPLWFPLNLLVVMWMLKYTVNITKRKRYQNFILAVIPIKNTVNWKKQTKTVLLCKNSTEITGYLHFLKKIQYNQRIRESKHLVEFIEEQSIYSQWLTLLECVSSLKNLPILGRACVLVCNRLQFKLLSEIYTLTILTISKILHLFEL